MPALTAQRKRLAAWTLLVAVIALNFWRVELNFQKDCEATNEAREEDLPLAFQQLIAQLGEEFEASPTQVEAAQERFDERMKRTLPPRDCGWIIP